MSDEVVIALVVAIPLVISSVAGAIASIVSAVRGGKVLVKSTAIEEATNGTRDAMVERITELEKNLSNTNAAALAASNAARQAAADVRAAIQATEPRDE